MSEYKKYYILVDGKLASCDWETHLHWRAETFDPLIIEKTTVGEIEISTIFLCFDHSVGDDDVQLFETMIFGGNHDKEQWRCATLEQAQQQHETACDFVRKELEA